MANRIDQPEWDLEDLYRVREPIPGASRQIFQQVVLDAMSDRELSNRPESDTRVTLDRLALVAALNAALTEA